MKTSILLLVCLAHLSFGQGTYFIQNNSSSVTILPNQITTKRPLGEFNTALGHSALESNTRDLNTAIGYRALYKNSTGAVGSFDGTENTAVGVYALQDNTLGYSNIGLGKSSLENNTVGYWNVAVGSNALDENVGGYSNVAIGYDAVGRASSVNYNTGIGTYALRFISGGFNTALGGNALAGSGSVTSNGDQNVAVGYGASFANTSGYHNISIGYDALGSNQTGYGNVAIGYQAGTSETGSNKLYIENSGSSTPLIGGDFSLSKVGINRSMANLASRSENLQVQGNVYITGNLCATSTNCVSDMRFKKNITSLENSLNNVLRLKGVNYDWRKEEFPEQNFTTQRQTGFIAQDLEAIYPEMVATDGNGYKSVDYARLTPVLVEALKELHQKIEALEINNQALKTENGSLKQQSTSMEARLQRLEKEILK